MTLIYKRGGCVESITLKTCLDLVNHRTLISKGIDQADIFRQLICRQGSFVRERDCAEPL